jgi:hypothetical protein
MQPEISFPKQKIGNIIRNTAEMGPVRFETEPNRPKPVRSELFKKVDRFGSVRFEIFSVQFGSV